MAYSLGQPILDLAVHSLQWGATPNAPGEGVEVKPKQPGPKSELKQLETPNKC